MNLLFGIVLAILGSVFIIAFSIKLIKVGKGKIELKNMLFSKRGYLILGVLGIIFSIVYLFWILYIIYT